MTNKKIKYFLIIIFFTGLSILLYPFISQYWNSLVQSKVITDYHELLLKKDSIDDKNMFIKAEHYNQELSQLEFPLVQYQQLSNVVDLMNITSNGMMGYITIDKIGVEIPIYHGTSSSILNKAVGHLNGSSLPVGGSSTHSVLSAHTGLPSAKLFTNLTKLEIGDTFIITIIDRKLTYQVDKITIVDPNDVSNLKIEKGKDYVTLITCTPYGLNTHRLLVRGTRINPTEQKELIITSDAEFIDKFMVTTGISILIFILFMIFSLLKSLKEKFQRGEL